MNVIKNLVVIFFSGVIFLSVSLFGLFLYVSYDLPKISSLNDYNPPIPSRIYSKDKQLLLEVGKERRDIVAYDQIPKRVLNAFLSAEDDNFYNHKGIDYFGLARAMFANLKAGRVVQGGSTITQQVAKSLLLSREKTLARKMRDFLLAIKIEEKFTKEEILFLYLNQVYLGGGYYGIKTAFKGYFNKELDQATIAECALIAGLLVAPGKYSPYVNPARAKQRQNYVLRRLYETGKITEEEYTLSKNEEIKILKRDLFVMRGGHFTDWVRQRVIDEVGADNFLNNGFEVFTTLDFALQVRAEDSIKVATEELDRRQGFKGPIRTLTEEEINDHLINKRKVLFDTKSSYFTFMPDGVVLDEFPSDHDEFLNSSIAENKVLESLTNYEKKFAIIGNRDKDPALKMLDFKTNYEAVVLFISDQMRIVIASVGGVKVLIPYDGFKWAHERNVSEEPKYYPFIQSPSTILKRGDVIWITVTKSDVVAWEYVFEKFKKASNIQKLEQFYKEQKFHVASLSQDVEVEGALLSLNPFSGEIIALVGGKDFLKSQFNRAIQANRQPGSAFKPFIYAAGLENGFTPASLLIDSPQALGGVDSNLDWKPRNYDGKFLGEMTFRRALEISRNIPTIKLLQDLGVDKVVAFTDRVQIKAQMPQDLSISLGSFGISLMELVKAYSIFPNGGKRVTPKSIISIKDRFGTSYEIKDQQVPVEAPAVEAEKPTPETASVEKIEPVKINPFHQNLTANQVYDKRLAYIMSNILKGVIQSGTGVGAKGAGSAIGGKTGTTNSYVDAWFLGFSSNIVTGVWAGMDNNQTMGFGETGAKSALPVWKEFMRMAIQKYGDEEFSQPEGIINVNISTKSGKLARTGDKAVMMESFVLGSEPGTGQSQDTDKADQSIFLDDDEYYSNQ